MIKNIFYLLVVVALIITGYHYFKLDQNEAFQKALKEKNIKSAEAVIADVVSSQIKAQAKQYAHDNNGYFVSKTNNICVSMQSNLAALKSQNPVECEAKVHSFTARIKTLSSSYYCLDTSGFYTTALTEPGFEAGVKCR
jgi:Tfp pilus assembly protein PilO